jgi:hypothetical protein
VPVNDLPLRGHPRRGLRIATGFAYVGQLRQPDCLPGRWRRGKAGSAACGAVSIGMKVRWSRIIAPTLQSDSCCARLSCSYTVLWNSFKLLTQGYSKDERAALFHGTATRVYRL